MLNPPINKLLEKVESRYSLVVAASKRARQIIEGAEIMVEPNSNKAVSIATQEIFEGQVIYTEGKDEKKVEKKD